MSLQQQQQQQQQQQKKKKKKGSGVAWANRRELVVQGELGRGKSTGEERTPGVGRMVSLRGGGRLLAVGCAVALLSMVSGQASAVGILSDPMGDQILFEDPLPAGTPVLPDIIQFSAGYTETTVEMVVDFASGTMTPGTPEYFFLLYLDTDLDASTGGAFSPGADKIGIFSTDLGTVTMCDDLIPPPGVGCGSGISVMPSLDRLEFTLPLGTGIDDDGLLRFGFEAGVFVGGVPVASDSALDGLSAPVPEPSTAVLLGLGLLTLAARQRRQRAD